MAEQSDYNAAQAYYLVKDFPIELVDQVLEKMFQDGSIIKSSKTAERRYPGRHIQISERSRCLT